MTARSPQSILFGAISVLASGGLRGATAERIYDLRRAVEAMPAPVVDRDGTIAFGDVDTVMRAAAYCTLKRGVTRETLDLLAAARGLAAVHFKGVLGPDDKAEAAAPRRGYFGGVDA